jgi:putative membrane protein
MRFLLRWIANGLAIYLALYLVDSVAGGRFRVQALWVVVILAVFLGLLNSLFRPLRRVRSKPLVALFAAAFTVLVNALILYLFAWTGLPVSATSFVWILAVAAFISVLAGAISWLVGFPSKEKPRPTGRQGSVAGEGTPTRERTEVRPPRERETRVPRART